MLNIMRNDWYRLKEQKGYLFLALGLTICAVILAVLLTDKMQPKMNLAVSGQIAGGIESNRIEVTPVDDGPARSQLIQGRYDAALFLQQNGSYEIVTAKSETFKLALEKTLAGKPVDLSSQESRQRGTTIIGYMLMFLLMQGVLYARLFAEDKEKRQIERIVCAPIPFSAYLAGHVTFIGGLIFLPSILVMIFMNLAGVSLGFALWQYALLIGLIAFSSTCFAMGINAFFCKADTANMVGSCIIVLTSVLSGSFYDMGGADLLSECLYILPQKNLMLFLTHWEDHSLNDSSLAGLLYVIMSAVIFLGVGIAKTKKDYIYKRSV